MCLLWCDMPVPLRWQKLMVLCFTDAQLLYARTILAQCAYIYISNFAYIVISNLCLYTFSEKSRISYSIVSMLVIYVKSHISTMVTFAMARALHFAFHTYNDKLTHLPFFNFHSSGIPQEESKEKWLPSLKSQDYGISSYVWQVRFIAMRNVLACSAALSSCCLMEVI